MTRRQLKSLHSGHAQASMVTEVYSHILDENRVVNADLFEKAFYSGKELPDRKVPEAEPAIAEQGDVGTIMKLLSNPESVELLKQLLAAMEKK